MSNLKDMFFSKLLSTGEIKKVKRLRKSEYRYESIPHELFDKYQSLGWEEKKRYKSVIHVQKEKEADVKFEDFVWTLLANMGFNYLNKDRHFYIPYSDDLSLSQQIDVIGIDDETILIIECKGAKSRGTRGNFKKDIEAIGGRRAGIYNNIRKLFPDENRYKVKFIFATKNYIINQNDIKRLEEYDIVHWDQDDINYFTELTSHLGLAARYQLLGRLFKNQKIPNIDEKVPAIKTKLGPYNIYNFTIEPERLLKIGYVLHRTQSNKDLMPTYQRIIKRNRIKKIEEFINSGGFFPNTIIINIDAKKPLRFDSSEFKHKGSISKVGLLYLPKQYRSAFIIDGQHRLYGYANTAYKEKNTIPVVAFENLDRTDQVELFMQINENQKSVHKNLRNTLNADLLWNSSNLLEAVKALKLRIAQELGENRKSPLYQRVIIGENKKSERVCITIDTIYTALNRSSFFGKLTKNEIKENGTFYNSNIDTTFRRLSDFIIGCLYHVQKSLSDEWDKGESNNGFLTINPTIYAIIIILSDIIDHISKFEDINPLSSNIDTLLSESTPYIEPLINYFIGLSFDEKSEIRRSYGTAGRTKLWRNFQRLIRDTNRDFNPPGLDQYIIDTSKQFNVDSFKMIREIELFMKNDILNTLKEKYKDDGHLAWWKKGTPEEVYKKAEALAAEKNRYIANPNEEKQPWDCLHLIDYRKIVLDNWRGDFEEKYSSLMTKGNKKKKTEWMHRLNEIRNQNFHEYSVSEEEYNYIKYIFDWLI